MLIRIWRLSPRDSSKISRNISFDPKKEIKLEEEVFAVESNCGVHHWAAILDSVLAGHEGWVYSVCWHPKISNGRIFLFISFFLYNLLKCYQLEHF